MSNTDASMKLVFVINGLRFGGMERQLVESVKTLVAASHDVHVCVFKSGDSFIKELGEHLKHPLIQLPKGRVKAIVSFVRLTLLIRRIGPNLIHVQDSYAAMLSIIPAKIMKIPLVNGLIRHAGASIGFDYYLEKALLYQSDYVIANSHAGLEYFGITKNCSVVYNFIDLARFCQCRENPRWIIMNANFSDYKDHLTLLFAGRKLLEMGLIERIGLIGDGKHRAFCETMANTLGIADQVVFHGHVHDVEGVLCDYGIGVLCSTKMYREGISNSILEYMGSGLIAIASDVGATREIIEHGVNGYLFEAESPRSLIDTIVQAFSEHEKWGVLRKKAKETLELKFNPGKNCEKLLAVYQDVIDG